MTQNAARRRMFDAPVEAWYVWLGLAAVSGAAVAVAGAMPAAPPPDAAGAANAVDRVAAGQYPTAEEYALPATSEVRVGSDSLSLRGAGGAAHAGLAYPVTPAGDDDRLEAVLGGDPPDGQFASPGDLADAAAAARASEPTWRSADRLVVRRVAWEEIDVVLVG